MKLVGNWYVPDYEDNTKTLSEVNSENWRCIIPLEKSFNYIKNFNSAIDVGTWIGDSTSILCKKFNNVTGFEANPDVFECCKKNLSHFQNLKIFNFALSNSNDVKTLFLGKSTFSAWINTLSKDQLPNTHVLEKQINSKTLDSFDFKNIDFIKIDIDSHEGYFLQGSENFFKNNSPVILIEYKPKVLTRQNILMPDPIKFLNKIGYKIEEQVSNIDYVFTRN
jgi:FkbM family methyltransferase